MTIACLLPLDVTQFLDQRAAVAGGAIELNGGMGDMEFVR
jgi:hypothetical protein